MSDSNMTKLFNSVIKSGNLDVIKVLVGQGLTLDDIRSDDNEALLVACQNGHLDIVKYLMSRGLDLNDIRSHNNAALRIACINGHLDIVKFLKLQGLSLEDIRSSPSWNYTAIQNACLKGHLDIVKYLVKQGLSLDDIRSDDNCTLRVAYENGHLDIVKYLEETIKNLEINNDLSVSLEQQVSKEPKYTDFQKEMIKKATDTGNKEMLKYVMDNLSLF